MSRYIVLALCACSGNAGMPAFDGTSPAPLASVGAPHPADRVHVHMQPLPWTTIAGTSERFVLKFQDDEHTPPPAGRRLGAVRSRDVELDDEMFDAVRCAWQIVPMGDPRPCTGPRTNAMALAATPITDARTDLAAKAGAAGANAVVGTRCFAVRGRRSRLWCEGIATAAGPGTNAPLDPTTPIDHTPGFTPTRLVLAADASVGVLGDKVAVGSTLSLRYRPIELGFYILDLQRTTLAPQQGGTVGLGGTLLGRFPLGRSRADAIAGVSTLAVFKNGSTNPAVDGLFHGFVGLAYQSSWRIGGVAQPFVQLRGGAVQGSAVVGLTPMVELHFGLTTPERR